MLQESFVLILGSSDQFILGKFITTEPEAACNAFRKFHPFLQVISNEIGWRTTWHHFSRAIKKEN